MLSRLARAVASIGPENTSVLPLTRLLHTTGISSDNDAKGTVAGSAGSEGAAPGRFAGSDEDVKFGDKDASPSSGELYGREDRDPAPSPNASITQATSAQMSFPRDEPSRGESEAAGASGHTDGSGTVVAKEEGLKAPNAYPIQNDPTIPEGAGPELSPELAQELQQDESSGPKAAGQGVVEGLSKEDPDRYGSGRSSPA